MRKRYVMYNLAAYFLIDYLWKWTGQTVSQRRRKPDRGLPGAGGSRKVIGALLVLPDRGPGRNEEWLQDSVMHKYFTIPYTRWCLYARKFAFGHFNNTETHSKQI